MAKKIIFGSLIVVGLTIVVALVGIYKFDYLSGKDGYDVDGDKLTSNEENIIKNSEENVTKNTDQTCEVDEDCTMAMTECSCDCGMPINKVHKQKYLDIQKEKCKNYKGRQCKMDCSQGLKCLNNVCAVKKESPISISPTEFKNKIDNGEYVLVDIRTPEEYQAGHIKGAINLDYYAPDFKEKVSQLDRNKKYLYYCRSGHRSGQAQVLAKTFSFPEVYELQGGINAWKEAGYKVE